MGNDVDMWEMAEICGKWLKHLTNGFINWELTERFWERAKIYLWNGLDNMGHGLSIWGTAEVCCKWLEYLKYGFDLW